MAGAKGRRRAGRGLARASLWGAALLLSGPACAEGEERQPPRWHLFFGLDSAEESFFGHGGLVWAPRGDLDHSGWRLRAVASGGVFSYFAGRTDITGELLSVSILPGFQWIGRDMGLTGYAGPTVQDQSTDPHDPGKPRQGTRFGARVLVEGWMRPVEGMILSASGSYATAAETYTGRLAATFDITPRLAVQPEFCAFGEPGYDEQRYGVLLQYRHRPDLHIELGGGWAVDPDDEGPYVAVRAKAWR